MADVEPLNALHYDLEKVGGLQPVAAPPYDVIDAALRAELLGQSPYNVVEVDLPQNGGDPYAHAAAVLKRWNDEGIVVRDEQPALWALAQDYTGPDGARRTRHGVFARVRVEDYGPGRIRPHERTHPGPKEDRLRLTRATQGEPLADLQPLRRPVQRRLGRARSRTSTASRGARSPTPTAPSTSSGGSTTRRRSTPSRQALNGTELLIADGHHRYETARVYQQEQPSADHVLMCLVALQDDGLTVFPTHRLAVGADMDALNAAIERDWTTEPHGHALASATTPAASSRRSTSRTGRSPTPRWRASPSPTAGSTPPSWRRCCSRARSGSARTTSRTCTASTTPATRRRRVRRSTTARPTRRS